MLLSVKKSSGQGNLETLLGAMTTFTFLALSEYGILVSTGDPSRETDSPSLRGDEDRVQTISLNSMCLQR